MKVLVDMKIKVNTMNKHATPHSVCETLKYQINNIVCESDIEVIEYKLDSYDPEKDEQYK